MTAPVSANAAPPVDDTFEQAKTIVGLGGWSALAGAIVWAGAVALVRMHPTFKSFLGFVSVGGAIGGGLGYLGRNKPKVWLEPKEGETPAAEPATATPAEPGSATPAATPAAKDPSAEPAEQAPAVPAETAPAPAAAPEGAAPAAAAPTAASMNMNMIGALPRQLVNLTPVISTNLRAIA